ncbi:MAG: DUF929 family protein [Jatrophihabitantaceae bacterium]
MSTSKKHPQGASARAAAQQRLAAQRAMAAASGASAARRKRLLSVLLPVVAVVVVIAVLVVVKISTNSTKPANGATTAAQPVVAAVTSVPAGVLAEVGAGSASGPTALSGSALTADGKPRVLYVGAEWCPYCAAERWPLAVALSRFGTLSGLSQTASTPNDVYPNTPTLSFHGATYSSTAISFTGAEIEDGARKPLDTLDAADEALFTNVGQGGFPFVDIGGKYLISNAQYLPSLLAGKSHAQVAAALSDPSSTIGKAIDGAANILTAAICKTSNDQPAAVCSSAGVTAAATKLG